MKFKKDLLDKDENDPSQNVYFEHLNSLRKTVGKVSPILVTLTSAVILISNV